MTRWLLALLLSTTTAMASGSERHDALQPSGRFSVYGHGAAATPPMGFNPWNAFRTEVDQARIEAVVDAIQQRGLQAAGYRYINIDDGWWLRRKADGQIEIRTSMFPIAKTGDGGTSFRAWTDALHARGFKAGLYTDIGRNACSQAFDRHSPNLPVGSVAEREIGLQGFEASDLEVMFQDWGFDYLKVDACGLADFGAGSEPVVESGHRALRPLIVRDDVVRTDRDAVETQYARVGRLLADLNPDNDYVLSICPWGQADVRRWGGEHGNLWRTSPDIEPTWDSMLHNFDSASRRELYAGPGRWNDPDMLAVGLGDFDAKHLAQARTHFSLWAILSAPLLLGFDVRHAPQPLVELLTNPEVIAVDQDPAGNQANLVVDTDGIQVLVKPLATRGERAVVLFNRGNSKAVAQVDAAQLKLQPDSLLHARDLWRRQDLPARTGPLRFALAPRETVMLKVSGTPVVSSGQLLSEMTGRIHVAADGLPGYSLDLAAAAGTPRADFTPDGQPLRIAGTPYRYGIGIHADSRLEVRTDGGFSRFIASVGLQDGEPAHAGKVIFRVYGDARLLYESAPRAAGEAPLPIDLPISGVGVLELVAVTGARAGTLPPVVAWADARLR
ncbi:NPCBM/NEW2 domain-containing protein [Pseudoxanthomonas sp.]|uniref:NPCBM/NEW2 domain-containing protein n=1 Tax=Pseudoxanthomonas sp. TaxID=1871049 RepID=UPI00261F1C13|nr:NPCBM/NEW2 domain-containing protein [Pseudoxanthomonas sp.]WDS37872.1 MAG: NPCBM/NEW2 domain-containing protein [Pseudoxanthomonas sp.]